MTNRIGRRELLTAGLGLCATLGGGTGLAQTAQAPPPREPGTDALGRRIGAPPRERNPLARRKAKTARLFLSPPGYPNAIDIDRDRKRGFWVHEQRHDNKPEACWLLDWKGK